jgi:fructokinase
MIVVAGEALVDLVARAGTDQDFVALAGGGPYNTARALGRLGVPVTFLGALSTDRFGRRLESQLTADGVDLALACSTSKPTTMAVVAVGDGGGASYSFYLEGTSSTVLHEAAVAQVPTDVIALHVGTLGLVLEPAATTTVRLVDRLASTVPVVLDPNIRSLIITDRDAHVARLEHVARQATIVKASEEDLAWWYPDLSAEDAAVGLLDAGPRLVTMTRGAAGVTAFTRAGRVEVPSQPVEVVDTIGAGDSFTAGLLCWLHEHRHLTVMLPIADDLGSIGEAVRFAASVAAVVVGRQGCDPPFRSEL